MYAPAKDERMNKILYLYTSAAGGADYFEKEREKVARVDCRPLYRKKGLINKLLLGLGYYLFSPLLYLIYNDWKKELNKYDIIILPSRRPAKYAVRHFRRKTGKRVIVWYWNTITKEELSPEYCRKYGCETWSFDKDDCKKYDMKFGDTYYFTPDSASDTEPEQDLFYVGVDKKGRKESLRELSEVCRKNNLSFDYYLIKNPSLNYMGGEDNFPYSEAMTYEEVIRKVRNSKAILDLTLPYQSGLTLRPLEALAFKRKLVTNNKVITESKAYDKDNTFIIDDNGLEGIVEFLKAPYKDNGNNRFEFYKFENWLDRIENSVEAY